MDILNAFKNWVDTGHFEEPTNNNNPPQNSNIQASSSAVVHQATPESKTNVFSAFKNWVDTGHFENPADYNESTQQSNTQASSSAAANQPTPGSNSHSIIPGSGFFESLLASAKNTLDNQTEQLSTTVSDLSKKISDQSQDTVSSAFSSAKSAILRRISPDKSHAEQIATESIEQISELIQKADPLDVTKTAEMPTMAETAETDIQSTTKTDDMLASISNALSASATTVFSQGKEKIHHSVEKLKEPKNFTPKLASIYQNSVSAIKSKIDKTPDASISQTDVHTHIKEDDQLLTDKKSQDAVNSMRADTVRTDVEFKQHEPTKTDQVTTTATDTIEKTKSVKSESEVSIANKDYLSAFPPQETVQTLKTKTVEPEHEATSTTVFRNQEASIDQKSSAKQEASIAQESSVQAQIQAKTEHQEPVKTATEKIPASDAIQESKPAQDNIQTKTIHSNKKTETVSAETLSRSTERKAESIQDPIVTTPKKSPFRLLIPLALLLLSLLAIWRLGLINLDFTNADKQVAAQQPVVTETQNNSIPSVAVETENSEPPVVIKPVPAETIAANSVSVSTETDTAQIEPQVTSEINPDISPAVIPETSRPVQTAVLNTPEQFKAPEPVLETKPQSLANRAQPLVKMESFIKSDNPLPAAFTLEGMRFLKPFTQLTRGSAQIISNLAAVMNAYPGLQIRLESHTDSRGSIEDNLAMTQTIADAAKAQMVNLDIDPTRIEAIGMGESTPLDGNHEDAWKSKNRRIIAVITAR